MLRKGYVERQIDELGQFLTSLLKIKNEGSYEAALAELRTGSKWLTGMEIDTVAALPEPLLLTMLGGGGSVRDFVESGKCVVLARLLCERAELFGLEGRADASLAARRRALMLYCEGLIAEPDLRTPAFREQVDILAAALRQERGGLSTQAQLRLFRYQDALGQYAKAEDVLYALRESPLGPPPGLREQASGFYRRLLTYTDDRLEAGGLPRGEVEQALAELGSESAEGAVAIPS